MRAATQLFQQRGYHGVGTVEILARARAPKGSMYHHFPGGKEQIATEAVTTIRDDVLSMLRRLEADERSVSATIRFLGRNLARWLKASQWREGSLLATIMVGSVPDLPRLHATIEDAMHMWCEHIARRLRREGWTPKAARSMADTCIASIEGGMVLTRITRQERVLLNVAETIASAIEARGRLTPRLARGRRA